MLTQIISLVWNLPPLVYVAIALATAWYWMTRSKLPKNVPPFPCKPYPLLGHGLMLGSNRTQKFKEWTQSTGEIFGLYLGKRYTVVVNSLNLMKEAFVKQGEFFSDRPGNILSTQNKGIVSNSGPSWKEQRSVSMAILRKFGMGKNYLAEKIGIEVEAYLTALSDFKGQPKDVRLLTNTTVSNVICAILIGDRFEFDDPYFTDLLKVINDQASLGGISSSLVAVFPWLKYLPGDFSKSKTRMKNILHIRQFSLKFITEFKKSERSQEENFITSYLSELEKKIKSNEDTYLDEDNLRVVTSNLFFAGTETTSTTLLWAMLFAIRYPDVQEKVYKEILDVVGPDRLPSMQDRPNMNYTNAYIMETQRVGSIAPVGLFHLCTKTTEVGGYTIPKDTVVIPNLDAVLKDKETWGDPDVFRPERFLDKDNNLIVPDEFIPFSIGRRYCMGESLAKMELFLFVTGMLHRFHIKPEDPDNLPTENARIGLTRSPDSFKPRFVERAQE